MAEAVAVGRAEELEDGEVGGEKVSDVGAEDAEFVEPGRGRFAASVGLGKVSQSWEMGGMKRGVGVR